MGSTEGSHKNSEGTSSGNNASHPDNLEKELNWDEILKSPFNFVEGSKDDNAMDSLVWDESFMGAGGESGLNIDFLMGGGGSDGFSQGGVANQGSTASQGVACFDMGGDDYKNATNSDFIIPGLPSLQPNLEELGIVDFGQSHYKPPHPSSANTHKQQQQSTNSIAQNQSQQQVQNPSQQSQVENQQGLGQSMHPLKSSENDY